MKTFPEKCVTALWGLVLSLLCIPYLQAQELEKLNNEINTTTFDEIAPVLSVDGHTLYFTRVGSPDYVQYLVINGQDVFAYSPEKAKTYLKDIYAHLTGRKGEDPIQSDFNQDIWIAKSNEYFFDQVLHPPAPLNNALPNSICAVGTEGNKFIVINQFERDGGMQKGFSYVYQGRDSSWTFPEPVLIKNFYTKSKGVNLTLSPDGEVMITSLERNKTEGQNDLYISFREGNNEWTAPKNLGVLINSPSMETNPSLSEDMQTLFFSSNRPGADGMDIYFSQRLDNTWQNWSVPRRLGSPVNSPADDSQPHFNSATGYLYFSSNRDGTSDIYRVQIRQPAAQDEVYITGRILDTGKDTPTDAKIYIKTDDLPYSKNVYVSEDGFFRIKVPKGKEVKLITEKDGFINHVQVLEVDPQKYLFRELNLDLKVDPVKVNAKISLNPIYFEQSKANILPESFPELTRLAQVLKDHPEISVEVEGHTDNIGEWAALQKLSEDRANAVVDFLMQQGIAPGRLEAKGYGASQPVNNNMNEEQRRVNRRVEVRITKLDD
ncbi:MAG: OmpA family protein [Phaeodactylibacter sp.]|nr:OmpA family protein [Phaeodactylibacter sp.]